MALGIDVNMKSVFKWMVVMLVVGSFARAADPSSPKSFAEAGRLPNILLIISDDQGYGDFGFTNPLL